jgi:hypothetical protein
MWTKKKENDKSIARVHSEGKLNGIKKNTEISSYHYNNNSKKRFNHNELTNQLVYEILKYNLTELPFCPCLIGPSNESSSEYNFAHHITHVKAT